VSSVLADCRSCLATATRQLQISAARPLLLEEPRCDVLCPAEQVRWQVRAAPRKNDPGRVATFGRVEILAQGDLKWRL
jgi:hypothetical protein